MGAEQAFPLDEVIRWASEITGYGITSDRPKLIDRIREVLDVLTKQESQHNLRKWCIKSCNGCITLPREIGTAEKYKIGSEVHPVRGKAYEFMGFVPNSECGGYQTDLRYLGEYPIQFDLPKCGGRVAAQSIDAYECDRDVNKRPFLIVQGKDLEKREVYTSLNDGKMDQGERIYVSQPVDNPEYSRTIFSEITSVRIVNLPLNIRFVWCNSKAFGEHPYEVGPLATYDPGEELPGFRRYFIPGITATCCYSIDILGKLAQPQLRYNNELIRGFDSFTIRAMLSSNWSRSKQDYSGASLNSNLAMGQLRQQNEIVGNKDTDTLVSFPATAAGNFPKMI